ncbi:hypothetical protein [Paratissierella segnis]|jgi:uncharacterized protein with NAD-binding domain and iron-sulfur cluster|uniref:DUF3168 domain-containing protein n=1 Tax=Paratissierella segnis TaxID=2763679 RepID=A0A926EZV1_9FIRM|nr:hypothetical protein [Paratissierella segnis]MBC8589329.1 hypothetical protein [Paratissierella segnis]
MIEVIIKNHLDSVLEEQVFLEKPSTSYGSYVVLEKTSSRKNNHLPSATFAFQSYGKSIYEAVELNERVKKAVESMVELDEIRGVKLNTDYNFTDTTTKEYRYQAVFDIKYY